MLAQGRGVPGGAADDAQALPCNLGAGWESRNGHGLLVEQGEIADGCARTCEDSPAWG